SGSRRRWGRARRESGSGTACREQARARWSSTASTTGRARPPSEPTPSRPSRAGRDRVGHSGDATVAGWTQEAVPWPWWKPSCPEAGGAPATASVLLLTRFQVVDRVRGEGPEPVGPGLTAQPVGRPVVGHQEPAPDVRVPTDAGRGRVPVGQDLPERVGARGP